ncbi:MAG: dienelactone hydrolase family protein [Planctomycetes bacterium]|nr:dienelactone hydrolase family protein [Planctomycetota bacterium]
MAMHSNRIRWTAGALAFGGLLAQGRAQVDRYELGLRLRAFERQLASCNEPEPRRAAMAEMESAVQAFFRLDTREVAAAIQRANEALTRRSWGAEERAASSLQLAFAGRLVDPKQGSLSFAVTRAWQEDAEWPRGLRLEVQLPAVKGCRTTVSLDDLPAAGSLAVDQIPPGEHELVWSVNRGDQTLLTRRQPLSVASELAKRLEQLREPAERAAAVEGTLRTIESATLVAHVRTLVGMTRKRPEETTLPGTRLLEEAEALAALADGATHYSAGRVGQFWLRVPLAKETAALRLYAPEVPHDARRPVVIALHGAGGSENLFFDGYGDGLAARLAAQRGWFLIAPRCSGFSGPDLPSLVKALAARWPIDTERIAVVGPSMGAQLAIASTTQAPQLYRAVAALGGGGSARKSAGLEALPFYVGAGARDFGRGGAQQLHERLVRLGAKSTWHEFPDVEHLTIVQFALPEVFEFFAVELAR